MYQSSCIFLYSSYLIALTSAAAVDFIDKCHLNDKTCLVKSSQKALPYFAAGIPSLGIPLNDPMPMKTVTQEVGGFKITFKDAVFNGISKCKVTNVEITESNTKLTFEAECPLDMKGTYSASGQFLTIPVTGDGPFTIVSDKVLISVICGINIGDGDDGQKHWKLGDYEKSFELKSKISVKLDNLFNGDEEKSNAVLAVFDQNWKTLVPIFGKPMLDEVLNRIIEMLTTFSAAVPASDLTL